MALRAIAVEGALQRGTRADVDQPRTSVGTEVVGGTVSGMASQAQERRGLLQQVVLDRPVRIVADRAILRHRRVLVDERPLLIGVTLVADHVDRGFFQAPFGLAVRIMTIRADHLPFLDGVVRWHAVEAENLGMALVAHVRLIDGHGHPVRTADIRVADIDHLMHRRVRVRIVTVGAGHAV